MPRLRKGCPILALLGWGRVVSDTTNQTEGCPSLRSLVSIYALLQNNRQNF